MFFRFRKPKGRYISLFENEFARYIGTKYAISTGSGRQGLELLLDSLKLRDGDEVIFPAYTLKDLIKLVKRKGLKPILVDIKEGSFNINCELIEKKITEKTRVIVATHIFGLPCTIKKISQIAERYNLIVIEDCAHSAGAEYEGRKVGSFGKAAFFSFETSKPISTFGGGMVVTNDEKIARFIRNTLERYPLAQWALMKKILYSLFEHLLLRSPLFLPLAFLFYFEFTTKMMSKFYLFLSRKANINYYKYTDLQAYLGLKQLSKLDERREQRAAQARVLARLLNKDNILTQKGNSCVRPFFYFYVVRINKNPRLIRQSLLLKGIDVGIKDEITANCSELAEGLYPITNEVYNSTLQLPFHEILSRGQIEYIADTLNRCTK